MCQYCDRISSYYLDTDPDFVDRVSKFLHPEDNSNFYFLTLNWGPEHSVEECQKCLFKIIQKKWIKTYYYTHEQRGEILPDLGKGYHVHLLIESKCSKPQSQVHREVYNTAKHLIGNHRHIDCRKVPQTWVNDKIDYLKGNKWDEEKDAKLQMDIIFRDKNGLKNVLPIPAPRADPLPLHNVGGSEA